MTIKNGDLPAMPCGVMRNENGDRMHPIGYSGLTKREQFAMAAMQGLFASGYAATIAEISADAVAASDALLAELECAK